MKVVESHVYLCASSTKQGFERSFENLILAKWNSMRHVDKKYQDNPDPLFPECAHEDDIEPRKWIKTGTFDYLRIKLLVK